MISGAVLFSSSLNSLVRLTVERTSDDGSMHDASVTDDDKISVKIANHDVRIPPTPDRALLDGSENAIHPTQA